MKVIASIRNGYMKLSAMTWLWIGSILIVLSIGLQAAALLLPSLAFALTIIGLSLNAVSVPFTIVQSYRSALEQQQLFEQERKVRDAADRQVFSETPKGRHNRELSKLRAPYQKDTQEPHS